MAAPTSPSPSLLTDASPPLASSSSSSSQRSRPPPAVHLVAGGLGGMCGSVVTAPFDLVKTRLQSDMFHSTSTSTSTSATSTLPRGPIRQLLGAFADTGRILRDIYKYEGPTALFKGLGPTLVGVVPGRSINFFVYGNGKQIYADAFNHGKENAFVHLSAAATAGQSKVGVDELNCLGVSRSPVVHDLAGVITAAATNPIWVVKTVMQLQQQQRPGNSSSSTSSSSAASRKPLPSFPTTVNRATATSSSFSHSFRSITSPPLPLSTKPTSYTTTMRIYRKEGIRGFYKGLSASLLGVTEGTIQWGLYEQFKLLARKGQSLEEREKVGNGGWRVSVAAGSAKLVATMITYPHEVIRTRLRQPSPPGQSPRYTSLRQSFKLVLAEEGWRALYGGMSPHLLRVVPNAVTMFWVYEKVVGMFDQPERRMEARRD
ncbi:BQ5605_C049g12421 [Microbotryum silenes-dioicae]|uniref:BQ5605_C049g12421 protein n=1 Tax=Microbotryum silenes-dioicae TaxID=796604 RepID=A0A2X0MSN7_9BASI|nr:BQ5605_C049g12421 [Microbotryum silenes-dioicae]